MSSKLTRRQFLQQGLAPLAAMGLAPLLAACETADTATDIPGSLLGPHAAAGHLLRRGGFSRPTRWQETQVVIVGGGISGLSAAWALHKAGTSCLLLELEAEAGGNSRAGRNAHTAFPWGAHYLPLPNAETHEVRALLEDMGLITGYEGGLPLYDEAALCHAPQERLWYRGRWQKGLLPTRGAPPAAMAAYKRFFAEIDLWNAATDAQGRPHFAIPLDRSSPQGPRQLDQISFAQYLQQQGYTSPELLWYLDYCCRDDYGSNLTQTSAWAGVHYFAGRRGQAANAPGDSELTWPMGNAYLARYLHSQVRPLVQLGTLVTHLQPTATGWEVWTHNHRSGTSQGIACQQVVYAAPLHTLPYVYAEAPALPRLLHTPWVVAQLHLKHEPDSTDEPLHWDNVNYRGRGVGYVLANHQQLEGHRQAVTLTYYYPLTDVPPAEARQLAQRRSHAQWCQLILDDLKGMHPDLPALLTGMDVWVWGHGMVAPTPGYVWGSARQRLLQPLAPGLHLAHTDVVGISIFEEAYCRGQMVASQVLA